MLEWSDEQLMIRDAIRQFVDDEIRPELERLDTGELTPYPLIRRLYTSFGLDEQARRAFGAGGSDPDGDGGGGTPDLDSPAMSLIAVVELCRVCPGLVTAMGTSVGLTASTIMAKGTPAQRERWALDLLTFDKIGAWAITEPGAGSDAFGSMATTARPRGDGWVLNGTKTFISNGPHADTVVVYAKLRDEDRSVDGRIVPFVLDAGMDGFERSAPLRKMGLHASPTGQLFLDDVTVGPDRLLGSAEPGTESGRDSARASFATERTGVAAMALGVIEECLDRSVEYARTREQWGRPIGEFQLIQEKLATMEVARLNVRNLVFRQVEMAEQDRDPSLPEASAMKLYAARADRDTADAAVQLFGGNGYMAEYHVEQLARDARSFRIYAGTDEIQVTHIARGLLEEA